uniref:Myb-like domain-containing protein n=1 Tax=Ananas comosus var. bracteatus TaxID=296719 RepID=A0A6V7PIL9_ANACO|nr:unnamed protein product [Ananas comosus var. bracteatus]
MADYSAGFHQGSISSSNYDHNLVSFQSEASHSSSVIANGFMSISDGNRNSGGMSLSGNPSAVNNMPAFSSPSASSSSNGLTGLMPKYKHVTASPAYWSPYELAILKEGLIRHAHEPNIMKYIKIAAMLPTRTVRDVALRCWWNAQNKDFERRRNSEEHYAGGKLTDTKMVASTSTCNNHLASPSDVAPFSLTRYHSSQKVKVTNEVPILDSVTRHLLDESEQLLIQIASNLELFKIQENMDPFLRTSNNIAAILNRMSQTPGIMCRMPPLPISLNEEHLNSLVQFSRRQENGSFIHYMRIFPRKIPLQQQ